MVTGYICMSIPSIIVRGIVARQNGPIWLFKPRNSISATCKVKLEVE